MSGVNCFGDIFLNKVKKFTGVNVTARGSADGKFTDLLMYSKYTSWEIIDTAFSFSIFRKHVFQINKLQVTQNKCIRYCLKLNARHHIAAKAFYKLATDKRKSRTTHCCKVF